MPLLTGILTLLGRSQVILYQFSSLSELNEIYKGAYECLRLPLKFLNSWLHLASGVLTNYGEYLASAVNLASYCIKYFLTPT